jgi:hypothetical protein
MRITILALLALFLGACAQPTMLVTVPPRLDLARYPTLGIVDFTSAPERALGERAARQLVEQVQAAQPGTRFIELGDRDTLLASVGSRQFDPRTLKKIGEKHGLAAVFIGELAYTEPMVDVKLTDLTKLEGGVRAEMKGEVSARLIETSTGASVWSRSTDARRQIGGVRVSADQGVSGGMRSSNPREAMLPELVYQLTHDFRPTTQRQPAR